MNQKGFSPVIVIGIAAAVIVLGGGFYFFAGQSGKLEENPTSLNEKINIPVKDNLEKAETGTASAENTNQIKKSKTPAPPEIPPKQTPPTPTVSVQTPSLPKPATIAPPANEFKSQPQQQNPAPQPASFQSTCVSNSSPVFTNHITDMSQVAYVVPPPTMGAGPSLKPHGYIGTNHARVPVYAPIALTLRSGAHYTGGPYMMELSASCEVKVRFGHITEPVEAIKNLLPKEPKPGSQDQELTPIKFKVGELLGYTTGTTAAGNWDFGVYNSSTSNRYASDPAWNNSSVYTTAVCPFGYFAPQLKAEYTSRFDSKILGGNQPHGESFCL